MIVLGVESSCDETGVALYCTQRGLLSHALFSQVEMHARYGGVVPELASRDHIHRVLPLIEDVLGQAGLEKSAIDGVAYTRGPGLMGALLVGASVAKSLAYSLGVPVLGVHHMEGHLLASMLEKDKPEFPFVALLVSGGHTLLAAVEGIGCYRILGESVDDAAGEAFDKTSKIMELGYPGGPALSTLAEKGVSSEIVFPRPMVNKPNLDFSFSGLKTAALLAVQNHKKSRYADIAFAFQEAVVDTLLIKSKRALKQTGFERLVVAGGVGANQYLRAELKRMEKESDIKVFYPSLAFCTDNGAMIALVGALRLSAQQADVDLSFAGVPRWPIDSLKAI